MADSRTRRKTPSRSRSSSITRSNTRSPSRVDMDDIKIELELRKKPTDRGKILTRKNMRHVGSVLRMASQPFNTLYRGLDTAYNTVYRKEIKKGTKDNQVDPALDRASEIPEGYPVLSTERGGKKKRKTQRKRKTRKNKK